MSETIKIRGSRVKQARKFRGISQADLASHSGISQSNLSFIEADRHNTNRDIVNKLADVLDVSVEWLEGKSLDGGIPEADVQYMQRAERLELSHRFVECYERLKTLGIIGSDAEFAEYANIPRSTLSLALAGKNGVSTEWVPYLVEKGANRDYIYHSTHPILTTSKFDRPKHPEDVVKNIMILMQSIEADVKLLKSYITLIM